MHWPKGGWPHDCRGGVSRRVGPPAVDGRAGVEFALQTEQLGTGHAVMVCRELLAGCDGPVLVVTGDAPLMQADSVAALLSDYRRHPAACVLGTVHKDDPGGLGRIVRDASGNFVGIVEHRDATAEQRQITEVNMSYYVFNWPRSARRLEPHPPGQSARRILHYRCARLAGGPGQGSASPAGAEAVRGLGHQHGRRTCARSEKSKALQMNNRSARANRSA